MLCCWQHTGQTLNIVAYFSFSACRRSFQGEISLAGDQRRETPTCPGAPDTTRVACHTAGISPGSAAEQRDPSRVTEQHVCHAVGISLGARRAERPFQGDKLRGLSCRRNLSAERPEQRDPYGVTELYVGKQNCTPEIGIEAFYEGVPNL